MADAQPARKRAPRDKTDNGDTVQALSRGLQLLECLASEPRGLLLTDLARRVGLAPSTTHRLLATLMRNGFAELHKGSGLWRVGATNVALGNAFIRGRDFVALARPYMRQLSSESGETSNLAVERDQFAVYVAQVESSATIRAFSRLGDRVPLTCSGVGLALLTAWSPAEVDLLVESQGLHAHTDKSIVQADTLHSVLDQGRKQGYVVDDEFHVRGMRCVAAPFFGGNGEALAALSLSGPASRLTGDKARDLGALVAETATEISRRIGGAAIV
ncbi:MAG: IclR family transcriptional regulator [Ectothiorhodospiraceae bacterium]|nr:IclR family transcriptional regulator [Ectothiorhodospiraceae bacterium]